MKTETETEYQGWTIDGRFASELDDAFWVEKCDAGASGGERWLVRVFIARPLVTDPAEIKQGFDRAFTEYGGRASQRQGMWSEATGARYSLRLGNGSVPAWLIEFEVETRPGTRDVFDFGLDLKKVERVSMKSCGQLTYADCDAILENRRARPVDAPGKYFGEFWIDADALREQLNFLRALGRQLVSTRSVFGIGPGLDAGEWELTEDGVWRTLDEEERGSGYLIVREMMILANRLLGEWCDQRNIRFLYRTQQAGARAAAAAVAELEGAAASGESDEESLEFWREASRYVPLERATYAAENGGHFALGFPVYGLFTSPLRRFGDFLNWMAIADYLDGAGGDGLGLIKKAIESFLQNSAPVSVAGLLLPAERTKKKSELEAARENVFWQSVSRHLSAREKAVKEIAALRREDDRISEIGEWVLYFSRERMTAGRAAFLKRKFDKAGESSREKLWKQIIDRVEFASDNVLKNTSSNHGSVFSSHSSSVVPASSFPAALPVASSASLDSATRTPQSKKKTRWTRITHHDLLPDAKAGNGNGNGDSHRSNGNGKISRQNGDGNADEPSRLSVSEAITELIACGKFGIRESFQWIFRPFRRQLKDNLVTVGADETIIIDGAASDDEIERDLIRRGVILAWTRAEWGRSRAVLEYGRQQKWLYLELEDVQTGDGEPQESGETGTEADEAPQTGRQHFCIRVSALVKVPASANGQSPSGEPVVVRGEGRGRTKAAAREAASRNVLSQIVGAPVAGEVLDTFREIETNGQPETPSPSIIIMNETKAEKARREITAARENYLVRGGNFVGWLNEIVQRLKLDAPLWDFAETKQPRGKVTFEARLSGEFIEQLMDIKRAAEDASQDFPAPHDGQPLVIPPGIGSTKAEAKQMAVRYLWEEFCEGETVYCEPVNSGSAGSARQVITIPGVERENYIAAVLEWLQVFAPGETLEFSVSQRQRKDLAESVPESDGWFKERAGAPDELLWVAELTDIPPIEGTVFRAAHNQLKRAKQLVAAEVYQTLQMCAAPKGD